jgi:hypothetical protein
MTLQAGIERIHGASRVLAIAAVLAVSGGAQGEANNAAPAEEVSHASLREASEAVRAVVRTKPKGFAVDAADDDAWAITGESEGQAVFVLTPPDGSWDFTRYSLFSISMRNEGRGVVWVQARLNNPGAQDWVKSSQSQAFILPGETGVVTVAYPRGWESDDSPEAFEPASAKPNGWRSHWKSFDAANVVSCRLVVRSNDSKIALREVRPYLSWPFGKDANASLLALPHIDPFGQAIPFTWDAKVRSVADLVQRKQDEAKTLDDGPIAFSRFGGDANSPKREATGYFRTEKIGGKWWLVDPEGHRFWSHGVCTVGNRAIAPLSPKRRDLFASIPEPGTPEHEAAIVPYKPYGEWGRAIDFLRLNTMRKYGDQWQAQSDAITHRRLKTWGLNTLGAWSDQALQDDRRTPFTEILHIWPGEHAFEHTPDPYDPKFATRLDRAVQQLAQTRSADPWMLGVFIDNEIVWHNNLVERVFNKGPRQPAYAAFVKHLRGKYDSLASLNAAWQADIDSWDRLSAGRGAAWQADRVELMGAFTERYYRLCAEAMDRHLPNHLYLGSRVHTCPPIVAEQIAKHADVFSINHYAALAGRAQVPRNADVPIMITEFHFGTMDRGITGMSLFPVHDQTQRVRSYAAYVTAAIQHPDIVGTHWFAYSDQSAVGRPNENYQIGLIDIADTPYAKLTTVTRAIGERMYALRQRNDTALLDEVKRLLEHTAGSR